jgi:hypothetical protein
MSAAFTLNIIGALRNPHHEARELEHTKITKQLERKIKKLNNQSKADSLTLAEKIAIKAQAKPLAEQLLRHKLNFHTFVLDGPEGAGDACLPQ